MPQLRILSPLSGRVWPLERFPDPVFAQKMVGDGLSLDPTDGHALTSRAHDGLEVLMRVGIDTVMLKGEGFHPRVKATPPIEFDLDFLATHAKSLMTGSVTAGLAMTKRAAIS